LESFFSTVLGISAILLGALYVLRRECDADFNRIEDRLGDEWYQIQSHIWASEVKYVVNDLIKYLEQRSTILIKKGSKNPLTDIFSDFTQLHTLRSRLNEIKNAYDSYLTFNGILNEYSTKNSNLKKWVDFGILNAIVAALWSGLGIYLLLNNQLQLKIAIWFWNSWTLIVICFIITFFRIIYNYNKIRIVKQRVREEKSKFQHVLHEGD